MKKAESLGAKVLAPPFDVDGCGSGHEDPSSAVSSSRRQIDQRSEAGAI